MSNLYNVILKLCESKGISGYRLCKDVGIQPSLLTDLKMGRQKSLSAANATKIANYFGASVDYLLGHEEQKNKPAPEGELDEKRKQLIQFIRTTDDKMIDILWDIAERVKSSENK